MVIRSARRTASLVIPALMVVALATITSSSARADFVYQSVNESIAPAPFYWVPSTVGWYWTPDSDILLSGIQTRLTTGFSNINNNFTLTASLWTDRKAVGGTLIDSFTFQGNVFVDGNWLGGSFSSPIALTGGTQYFLGFSGWDAVLTPTGGGGVNWIEDPTAPGAQNLGAGSGYLGADWEIQGNPSSTPANIDSPILRFIGATPVPEPSSLALVGLGALAVSAAAWRRRGQALS